MIELPVTLTSTGGAVSFASPVPLGYTKNKGVYRLLITAEGEWQGLTIRCFWHLPGGTDPASSLVQDGFVDVPASVTAQPGTGCITFEGSDGEKTVTSADLRYKVGSNSGTEDGTMPEPGTPAWEQLVSEIKANADGKDALQIDDAAISTTSPWSSKQIVDTLCPPLKESGNPVVCYPVAGYSLGVKASWEPMQEGSGTTSPENIRPIKGRDSVTITRQEDNQVITLTLPETVYGGEVDAVSGEGQETQKFVILNGTESWNSWGINAHNPAITGFYTYDINDYDAKNTKVICSHLETPNQDVWGGRNAGIGFATVGPSRYFIFSMLTSSIPDISAGHEAASLKAYLAAQNDAGTPVQIAYKLAEPMPFSATGAQPLAALAGANTVLTDADSATVTGRADPIKRIADLENKE